MVRIYVDETTDKYEAGPASYPWKGDDMQFARAINYVDAQIMQKRQILASYLPAGLSQESDAVINSVSEEINILTEIRDFFDKGIIFSDR